MTLPQVGDIVHWTGDKGPNHVLVIKRYDSWQASAHIKVLSMDGQVIDDDEWVLGDANKEYWSIVA